MRVREASLVAVPPDDLRRACAPHLRYLPGRSEEAMPVTDHVDAQDKLIQIVCPDCLGEMETPNPSLGDLLGTPCGLEWAYVDAKGEFHFGCLEVPA